MTRDLKTETAGNAQGKGDIEKALLSIRQARDAVLAQNHELIVKLAEAQEQLAVLSAEREGWEAATEAAVARSKESFRELSELRRQNLKLTSQQFDAQEAAKKQAAELAEMQDALTKVSEERDALRLKHQELEAAKAQGPGADEDSDSQDRLVTALQEACHKIADLEAQAEGFKAQQKKNTTALTKHLTAATETVRQKLTAEKEALELRISELEAELNISRETSAEAGTLAGRLEQQRQEISELTEQLAAARAEVADLQTALGAARSAPVACPVPALDTPLPAIAPENGAASTRDASSALGAIHNCLEMLAQHPTAVEFLEELDSHLAKFSETALQTGRVAIHGYAAACQELTAWMRKSPAKITSATLRPVREAADLLARLTAMSNAAAIPDPADALVYAVDDDLDNCECIAMSLAKVQVRTKYAVRPEVALADLQAGPCDLVVLDVDMPRMDGFDLATRIRQGAHHAHTPIVFLSGLTSAKDRLENAQLGAATFLAKPYNLKELGLKVLGLILEARAAQLAA